MLNASDIPFFTVNEAKALLPAMRADDNKAHRGKSFLIAGSGQYPGAGFLCARAALRAGSGYVYLAQSSKPSFSETTPEIIPEELKLDFESDPRLTIAIGPGTGTLDVIEKILHVLSARQHSKLVVDADALTILARGTGVLPHAEWVLTPHEGELARLLNISSEEISKDRGCWVQRAQKKYGCVIVLKGDHTLVADENGLTQNSTGNAGLAKAGTGDVLTGIITALRAQGLSASGAARTGVLVHGLCADLWVKKGMDFLSLTASDVIDLLPEAFYEIRNYSSSL